MTYCPANLEIVGAFSIFDGFNNVIEVTPGCFQLNCQWPSQDADFCVDEIVPDYFGTVNGGEVSSCNIRKFNVYQLLLWFDDLVNTYPDFVDPGNPFGLYTFLQNVQSDPNLTLNAKCATATFCLSDFTLIGTDIYSADCYAPPAFPDPQPCTCDTLENSTTLKCWCKVANCPDGCVTLAPVFIDTEFPGDLNFSPENEGGIIASRYYPVESDSTRLGNYAFSTLDGVRLPKGLITGQNGSYFEDFTHHSKGLDRRDMNDIRFFEENLDNDQIAYLSKSNPYQYAVYFEDSTSIWIKPLHTTDLLKLDHLALTDDGIVIAGSFKGDLSLDSNLIQSTGEEAIFTLLLNTAGTIESFNIFENLSMNNRPLFHTDELVTTLTGTPVGQSIKVNGNEMMLQDSGQVFTVVMDQSASVLQINDEVSYSEGLTLKEVSSSKDGSMEAYLFYGSGAIMPEAGSMVTTNADQWSLVVVHSNGNLLFADTFTTNTIMDEPVLGFTSDNNLMVGLTFTDTFLMDQGMLSSSGGKDILLINYDPTGAIVGMLPYGSPDDEEISALYAEGDLIYFGGTFYGSTEERQIGYYNFINHSNVNQQAFLSFVTKADFLTPAARTSIVQNRERKKPASAFSDDGVSEFDLIVFPNPSKEHFQIELQNFISPNYKIEVFNSLGKRILSKNIQVRSEHREVVTEQLHLSEEGIYFLVITDAFGNTRSQKIIKY